MKRWESAHRQERMIYKKNYINALKKIVFDHYSGGSDWKCACPPCSVTSKTMLTIDHVNNDGHKHVTKGGHRVSSSTMYIQIIKAGFPDSYQILCWNCNSSKRFNNGVCEHIT